MPDRHILGEDNAVGVMGAMDLSELLDRGKNYIVRRRRDLRASWSFQVYETQLSKYARKPEFYLVVVCDWQEDDEQIIAIPYSDLKESVLPRASLVYPGRYLFEVNKATLEFNWHHLVHMDGRRFLVKGKRSAS